MTSAGLRGNGNLHLDQMNIRKGHICSCKSNHKSALHTAACIVEWGFLCSVETLGFFPPQFIHIRPWALSSMLCIPKSLW